MKKLLTIITLLCTVGSSTSQNVGIGTNAPHTSAALEVKNNAKGVLLPTMTTTQRNNISSPAKGLLIYDTTFDAHYYYTGSQWKPVGSTGIKADSSLSFGNQVNPIQNFIMGTHSQSSDTTGFLYDNGGPAGNYGNNRNDFFQLNLGMCVAVVIELFQLNTEAPYDSLKVFFYGGQKTFSGNTTDTLLLASPYDNAPLEFSFATNGVNTASGFGLKWKKIFPVANSNNNYDSTQLAGWYFNPEKNYMRAGLNTENNWHPDSSGKFSFAYGNGTQARGDYSISVGRQNKASGKSALAIGDLQTASGSNSVAIGYGNVATGYHSLSIGYNNLSAVNYSTSIGYYNEAKGEVSFALGGYNRAENYFSFASGYFNRVPGYASTAMGEGNISSGYTAFAAGGNNQSKAEGSTTLGAYNISSGDFSLAAGLRNISKSFGGTVVGIFNDSTNAADPFSPNSANRIFQIGNGNSNIRSNAMTVLQNGNVGIGVLNPQQMLSIASGMNIDDNNQNAGTITSALRFGSFSGEAIGSKRTAGGNQFGLDFYTNSTNRLSITQNGNVGIGVANPQQMLSIASGMSIDESNSNNGTAVNALRFGSNSGEAIGSKRTAGGNQYGLDFYINFVNRMSITSAGNVGIGTTAPAVPLQFANAAGNKISLFQNGSNHYGIGTQASVLQIFTPTSADDIAFGYGNSGAFTENIRMDGSGSLAVKTNLTVQNNKGIIRNTSATQLKQVITNALVNPTIGGLATHSQTVTWSEAFGGTPVAAYVGNCGGTGGWAEVVVSIASVTNTGCILYVFNPRNITINPNFTVNIVTMGPQ